MSCRALNSKALSKSKALPETQPPPRHEAIMGLEICIAWRCRCGCALIRIVPHSKVSDLLVWKYAWCKRRKGKPTTDEVEALVAFTDKHGWNMRPLRWSEADGGYHVD
jgi:hypothetical protein